METTAALLFLSMIVAGAYCLWLSVTVSKQSIKIEKLQKRNKLLTDELDGVENELTEYARKNMMVRLVVNNTKKKVVH